MKLYGNFNQTLLARALFFNFALVGVSVTLLTGVFLFMQFRAIQSQIDLQAKVLAGFVATQSEFAMLVGDRAELERIARLALSNDDVLFVELNDRAGESIRVSKVDFPPEQIPAIDHDPRIFQIVQPVFAGTGNSVVEWENKKAPANRLGTIHIGFSRERQEALGSRTLRLSLPIVLLSLVIILGVQYTQLRRLLEPLKGLIDFTRQVGRGERSLRAPVQHQDEVGRLAEAFNSMVEELGSTTVSKDYVNNIVRSMGESLVVIGLDRTIRTVNQATLSMLGYSEQELVGSPAELILSGKTPATGGSTGIECVYRLKNGAGIPVLFSSSAMVGENGACEGQVWLAQDMTARKLAEEELREAKGQAETANRAKSDLLSRTSHELRTPLNSILGFGQLLELSELSADDRESVDRIMKAGRHLLSLINEVLDIAGIETGRRTLSREAVRIGEAAYEAMDMVHTLAEARGIKIRGEMQCCDSRYVLADRQRLQQVLLNLLSNAIKYNRQGGTVTLACRHTGVADTLRLAITDTGLGISPEGQTRLFVPFERLGAAESGIEGTGLGLAFTKLFVEAMGGSIGVESTVGEGTTFWLELALAAAPASESEFESESGSGEISLEDCGERTVLYIEDNLSNLELVQRILRRSPQIRIVSAVRGDQGVELAREHRPDLILLDLHLPDIWGDEVLHRIRADAALREIPIIMLSADATAEQIKRLLAAGAQDYLTKPINRQELLRTMYSYLKTGDFIRA